MESSVVKSQGKGRCAMQNRLLLIVGLFAALVLAMLWKLNNRIDGVESKTEKTVDDAFRKAAASLNGTSNAGAQAANATPSGAPQQNQAAGTSVSGVDEFAQAICRLRNGGCTTSQQAVAATGQAPGTPSGGVVPLSNRSVNLGALAGDVDAVVEAANKIRRAGNTLCDPTPMSLPTLPMPPGQ